MTDVLTHVTIFLCGCPPTINTRERSIGSMPRHQRATLTRNSLPLSAIRESAQQTMMTRILFFLALIVLAAQVRWQLVIWIKRSMLLRFSTACRPITPLVQSSPRWHALVLLYSFPIGLCGSFRVFQYVTSRWDYDYHHGTLELPDQRQERKD